MIINIYRIIGTITANYCTLSTQKRQMVIYLHQSANGYKNAFIYSIVAAGKYTTVYSHLFITPICCLSNIPFQI